MARAIRPGIADQHLHAPHGTIQRWSSMYLPSNGSLKRFVSTWTTTFMPQKLPPICPGRRWVTTIPFFIILNLAVGGNLPASPDTSTEFPQRMLVDYVRVYSRK